MGLMKSKNGLFVLQMQPLQSLQPTCLICPSTQCKASRITAILKIAQLATCQDYRPISITPMEKELVRSFPYSILLSWYSVKYSVTSLLLGQLAALNLPSFIFCIRSQVFSGIMNMFTALPWTSQMLSAPFPDLQDMHIRSTGLLPELVSWLFIFKDTSNNDLWKQIYVSVYWCKYNTKFWT